MNIAQLHEVTAFVRHLRVDKWFYVLNIICTLNSLQGEQAKDIKI